jgi:hypothetical protein
MVIHRAEALRRFDLSLENTPFNHYPAFGGANITGP